MPVLQIRCPDCDHQYRSLVPPGARIPTVWVCSKCGGRNGRPEGEAAESEHPWSDQIMDACCG